MFTAVFVYLYDGVRIRKFKQAAASFNQQGAAGGSGSPITGRHAQCMTGSPGLSYFIQAGLWEGEMLVVDV